MNQFQIIHVVAIFMIVYTLALSAMTYYKSRVLTPSLVFIFFLPILAWGFVAYHMRQWEKCIEY